MRNLSLSMVMNDQNFKNLPTPKFDFQTNFKIHEIFFYKIRGFCMFLSYNVYKEKIFN